jgi:carbamoyltransferase
LRFAEAAERHLQTKRAISHDPDSYLGLAELLREYCEEEAELIVATSWSRPFASLLKLGALAGAYRFNRLRKAGSRTNRSLLGDDVALAVGSMLCSMQEKAGIGVLIRAQEAFGHSRVRLTRYSHHRTHAALACYTSPFTTAVCAVIDGMGELGSMAFYTYQAGVLRPVYRHWGLESVGFLYGLVTDLCGYDWRLGEEWKVMGLAPYGQFDEELYQLFRRIYCIEHGRLRFSPRSKIEKTVAVLKTKARAGNTSPLTAANMAFVGQYVFAEIMTELLGELSRRGISENLALAGGCALNCSFNGTITERTGFKHLFVPCAPGDDGNAVGAALLAYMDDHPGYRPPAFQSPYLGSRLSIDSLRRLASHGYSRLTQWPGRVHEYVARLLADGKLIGWVQGRAEFGPRALGNRSILADPRNPHIRTRISETVKLRENFRPFAPSIIHEYGSQYFENYQEAPYMERALRFRSEVIHQIPAVVHVDGTGRAQTVKREWNERFYDLIESFRLISGVPILLNTSLNVMGRPIVHSLEDAVGMFYTTGLDALVIDDAVLEK